MSQQTKDNLSSTPTLESGKSQKNTGIVRIIKATGYSLAGLRSAFRTEPAFRQELAFAIVLAPLSFVVGRTLLETAILLSTLVLVLIVELLNTAIEAIVDLIGPERTDLSGMAKDLGSAAVMLSLMLVVIVWSLVLFSRFGG